MNKPLLWAGVFLYLFLPTNSFAQNISFEASVDQRQVYLAGVCQLTLTVTGARNISALDIDNIDGFDVQYIGPSTNFSFINGRSFSSVAHRYHLYPKKIGKFQIPSFQISIKGQTYQTDPIDVEVVDVPASSAPGVPAPGTAPLAEEVSLDDKIFVVMEIAQKKAYLNEKIPLTIRLFSAGLSIRDIHYPEFEHAGFSVDEYEEPKQYDQNIGGVQYNVVEFNTAIYPTRTGELTLGPAKMSANLLYRTNQRRSPFDDFDSFFGDAFDDDFFGGLMGGGVRKRPIAIQSTNVIIEVLDLPRQGKPKGFSGAVGKFQFDVLASPTKLKVGDPITLKVKIAGDGNLKAVDISAYAEDPSFKVYDPQVKEENGVKVLEQVLIPKSEEVKEIPAVSFSFFDPKTESYKTISKGPFPLEVSKGEQAQDFRVVEYPQDSQSVAPETLGRDLIFIKDQPGNFQPRNFKLHRSLGFLLFMACSFLLFAVLVFMQKRTQRLKTDIVYARKLRAPKKAKKGLNEARHFMQQKKQSEFYDAVFRTLQQYLGDKFHLSSGAVTYPMIGEILKKKNCNGKIMEQLKELFESCDMVRYASITTDQMKMKDIYKSTEEVIDYLERL